MPSRYPLSDVLIKSGVPIMKTDLYIPRLYRTSCQNSTSTGFLVRVAQSDLFIKADIDLTCIASRFLSQLHDDIRTYIDHDISFVNSLTPITVADSAPTVVRKMAYASSVFDVGPMASVAGAISEEVARYLHGYSKQVLVENGGDLYVINHKATKISICTDYHHPSGELLFELQPSPGGIGICTSSGTIGHSLSFGHARAVTVISGSGYSADAAATTICNMMQSDDDVEKAIQYARRYEEIIGLIIMMHKKIGIFGEKIKLI
jgi:ApbE superfamily uncharacterized protein (UPF0280 family)